LRGTRARLIRAHAYRWNRDFRYRRAEDVVHQVQEGGAIKRIIGALADALKHAKTFAVTGQIVCPAAMAYRRMKRTWTRLGRLDRLRKNGKIRLVTEWLLSKANEFRGCL
jgi:hypothetical protein